MLTARGRTGTISWWLQCTALNDILSVLLEAKETELIHVPVSIAEGQRREKLKILFKETKNKTFSIGKKLKYLLTQPPKHKIIPILMEIFLESLLPPPTQTHT